MELELLIPKRNFTRQQRVKIVPSGNLTFLSGVLDNFDLKAKQIKYAQVFKEKAPGKVAALYVKFSTKEPTDGAAFKVQLTNRESPADSGVYINIKNLLTEIKWLPTESTDLTYEAIKLKGEDYFKLTK